MSGWPGQAVSYKLGELESCELRRHAEARPGAGFDLRAFHDVVPAPASVPLAILEEQVDAWFARRQAS
jgi:uncharacterized protein (DUF885 family)